MLEEYKKKEIARCDKVIASYQEDIDTLQAGVDELKEKYKKVFEEIEETNEIIGYYRESQAEWEHKKAVLEGKEQTETPKDDAPKPRKRRCKVEVPAAPADVEKVVDTVFPDNNESVSEDTVVVDEQPAEEPAVEESSTPASGDLFETVWPEASQPDMPAEEIVDEEPVTEEEEEEEDGLNVEDDFPEFPEEWNN
jgi:hypothetical protein